MAIENIWKSGMLDIALRNWEIQTSKSSWVEFTVFMYRAEKYQRDTAATTRSAGSSSNFHAITSEYISSPPSLATTATSDISELASTFSATADAQTAQITALMAAMVNQQMPTNSNNARRNSSRQGGNRRGKKSGKKKSYCWTHGVTANMEHGSDTCDNQHTGHQETATFDNRMGGSEHICGSGPNPCGPGPAN